MPSKAPTTAPTKTPTRNAKSIKAPTAAKKEIARTRARVTPTAKPAVKAKGDASNMPRVKTVAAPASNSKQARLIDLLRAAPGGTIDQMMKLTGWQAHTVRGTISGVLRKRLGLNVACATDAAGARVYRIVEARP